MHHTVGIGLVILLIGFAFGERVARVVVGTGLILAAAASLYIGWLIVSGAI